MKVPRRNTQGELCVEIRGVPRREISVAALILVKL